MLQKYRADRLDRVQSDNARVWVSDWIGGPTIAKIENCRVQSLQGEMRRTVYITGEPDTVFSIPAVCSIAGKRITGYVTGDHGPSLKTYERCYVFRHCYY